MKCIETGIIYKSIKEAAEATGSSKTCIGYACRGTIPRANKLHWEYVDKK